MAAHALTLINELLARSEITDKTFADVSEACNGAPGFDIPALDTDDWHALYDAAKSGQPTILKSALEAAREHVSYQEYYRTVEHLRSVRHAYVDPDTDGWLERGSNFETLSHDEHIALAAAPTAAK